MGQIRVVVSAILPTKDILSVVNSILERPDIGHPLLLIRCARFWIAQFRAVLW